MIVSLLRRMLLGPEPRSIEHPVFGRMLRMEGGYWEVEYEQDGAQVSVGVDVPPGEDGPSETQAAFFQRIRHDPEIPFRMGEQKLRAEYESWVEEPFPSEWRDAFRLVGFSVPVQASEQGTWDASFECLAEEGAHHFTCWFENGVPVSVSVDG